jgi:hypothetical protein
MHLNIRNSEGGPLLVTNQLLHSFYQTTLEGASSLGVSKHTMLFGTRFVRRSLALLGVGFLFVAIVVWLWTLEVLLVTGTIIASIVVFSSLVYRCLIHRSGKSPGEGSRGHLTMHRSAH